MDYDETEDGDQTTMTHIESVVNAGRLFKTKSVHEYSPSVSEDTQIRITKHKCIAAKDIRLGDGISTGIVQGIIKKRVSRVCELAKGEYCSEGTLTWCPEKAMWVRAAELSDVHSLAQEKIFYSFVVTPTAQIELASGHQIRDYVEVHSPDSEQFYAKKITEVSSSPTTEGGSK